MIVFARLLAAAWLYRTRPEIHKQLIVVATVVLLVASVHRMIFMGGPPPPWPLMLLIWLAPICLAMAHDYARRRIAHPVYLVGIAAVLVLKFRGELGGHQSATWLGFVDWLSARYR